MAMFIKIMSFDERESTLPQTFFDSECPTDVGFPPYPPSLYKAIVIGRVEKSSAGILIYPTTIYTWCLLNNIAN